MAQVSVLFGSCKLAFAQMPQCDVHCTLISPHSLADQQQRCQHVLANPLMFPGICCLPACTPLHAEQETKALLHHCCCGNRHAPVAHHRMLSVPCSN